MNDNEFNYAKGENVSDNSIATINWATIQWEKATEFINRLQLRIAKAVQAKKWNLVKRLQYLLVNSFYAKVLAIKKVSSNKGKKTAGMTTNGVIPID